MELLLLLIGLTVCAIFACSAIIAACSNVTEDDSNFPFSSALSSLFILANCIILAVWSELAVNIRLVCGCQSTERVIWVCRGIYV